MQQDGGKGCPNNAGQTSGRRKLMPYMEHGGGCAAKSARKRSFVGADMNSRERDREAWPDLPYRDWDDTCATLQLWTQIVGKIRLSQTPWLNHSWRVS